jgi:hypothetical protein
MTPRRAVRWLLVAVLALPLGQAVLTGTAGLLAAMGDDAAAGVVRHVVTALGACWIIALVGLVVAIAFAVVSDGPPESRE